VTSHVPKNMSRIWRLLLVILKIYVSHENHEYITASLRRGIIAFLATKI